LHLILSFYFVTNLVIICDKFFVLLDIIEDRHGKSTTIIKSQVPVKNRHQVIGEKTLADAILDRIVHQSIRIEIYGESLKKMLNKNSLILLWSH